MLKGKRILICPLDWGLGHATRCVPIIRLLIENNAEVMIAADKRPLELLKQEFSDLKFITLKGYEINYSKRGSMILSMLLSIPKILKGIHIEHKELDKIVDLHNIDIVISDNRYGCWNKKVKSIFITHQLMIKTPFFEKLLHRKIQQYIKKYDECWIPDYEGENNLSGDLSHKYELLTNTFFIGPLTRFSNIKSSEMIYDVMAIVSGPEPQRTIFEKILFVQLSKSGLKSLIVLGLPDEKFKKEERQNVTMISHLDSFSMQKMILKSNIIIARSGYSTIMDLASLNKKVIFIPTPGQTEQEYLAEYLKNKKMVYSEKQSNFDLENALKMLREYSNLSALMENKNLIKHIKSFLVL